ncbi:MAG: hypothetical protein PHE54_00475 [Bacilli bacterium]|nr:hypothetical protein [Bacilli bacterium]
MNKKKNKMVLVGLLLFTLALTGVYALLAANLNISGTASGTGDFKIEFSSFSISDDAKATASLDSTKTSLTVDADLTYPGDSVSISFTIKNTGSLPATVSNLNINDNSTDDFNIVINGLSNIVGETLNVNEVTNGTIVITWNASSTNANPESVNFDVTIDYLQATI